MRNTARITERGRGVGRGGIGGNSRKKNIGHMGLESTPTKGDLSNGEWKTPESHNRLHNGNGETAQRLRQQRPITDGNRNIPSC